MRGWPLIVALLAIGCAARRLPLASSFPAPPGAANPAAGDPVALPRSLLDGVYSAEQSQRGEAIYFATCARCHRPEMTGSQIVPPLIGQAFLGRWSTRTAGDLFEWVRISMPPGLDVKLSPQEYADVLSYVFSRNEFPAGREEMAADFATLRTIRIAPESMESDGSTGAAVQR